MLLTAPVHGQEAAKPKTPTSLVRKPVYDEKADAKAQIQAALAKAKKENRRVLIEWGANWCSWCILLHDAFQKTPDLHRILSYEYDVVFVDVGRRDHNIELATSYGADLNKNGIPYLTVLDSAGKVVVHQGTEPFEVRPPAGEKGHDAKKVQAFLVSQQAKYHNADEVLTAGLAEAERSGRSVLLHFGAPWCGWCHRLDDWLARSDVAPVMGKDYVDVKVDIDRMDGGKEIFKRYNPKNDSGIPWFVILDSKGKAKVDCMSEKGNIGFPYEEHEVAHFLKMLEQTKQRLTDAEITVLKASLAKPVKTAAQ